MELVEIKFLDPEFTLQALPDSGAARTVIPKNECPERVILEPSRTVLGAANGTPLRNLGKFQFNCQAKGGPTTKISAFVSPDIKEGSGVASVCSLLVVVLDL